ncbi:MAG: hypothetical protein EAX96_12945 [Candidatus Lokiarchaeota archaeon]|nr:hypothetical protein [Candidatus Lokiarchaeota archaeon]
MDEEQLDKPLEFSVVSDLGPRMRRMNLKVKCESLNEIREVASKNDGANHKVTEALVGDETGSILLTLWDDTIDRVEIGKSYMIKNSYTSIFRGSLRLNLGKYGELEDSEEEISEINTENNLSEKVYQAPRRSFQRGGGGGGYRGPSGGGDRDYGGGYRRRNPRDRRGGGGGGGRRKY